MVALAGTVLALGCLIGGCTDYPQPGSYSPINLLCTGDYDVDEATCTVPVDLSIGLTP